MFNSSLVFSLIVSLPALAQYSVIDLGVLPGGNNGAALALNDRGQVVGWSATGTRNHAFVWRGGRMMDLGVLPGFDESYATGINNIGQIAGYCMGGSGTQAFVWQNGTMTALGGPGSKALGINNLGQIVGSITVSGAAHAAMWQNGAVTDLGTLPGDQASEAAGINDLGQVVGRSAGTYGYRPVLWVGSTATALPYLNGTPSACYATDINNFGQIAGSCAGSAVLWQGGVVQEVRSGGSYKGSSVSISVNDSGQVAGTSPGTSMWIWQGGVFGAAPNLGRYGYPAAINRSGQVAGQALLVDNFQPWAVSFPQITRPVLTVPTPAPGWNTPVIKTNSMQSGGVLEAKGGTPPYTWTMNSSADYPLWVQPESGVVSGTPATTATGYLAVTVTDSTGQTATKKIAITSGRGRSYMSNASR